MTTKLILINTDTHAIVPREAVNNLLSYVNSKECLHEDTYRGGVIWTICRSCGRKWADDEGGFEEYTTPKAISDVEEALAAPQLTTPPVLRWEAYELLVWNILLAQIGQRKDNTFYAHTIGRRASHADTEQEARRAAEKVLGLPEIEEV